MANAESFTRTAVALPDVLAAPHFERTAFKVKRIFATLASNGKSANLNFTPDEQELKCMVAPALFHRIDNGWGRQGWTTMWLAEATDEDVRAALEMAHAHATEPARKR
jgi:hypothetical protein